MENLGNRFHTHITDTQTPEEDIGVDVETLREATIARNAAKI